MDLKYINLSQICSIECYFIRVRKEYVYREYKPKNGFFSREQLEGFYDTSYYEDRFFPAVYFDNNRDGYNDGLLFRKGNKIYRYPFINIKMSNGDTHKKNFKTNYDMIEFLSKNLLSNPNIIWVDTKTNSNRRNVLLEKYQGYSDELRVKLKNSLSTDKDIRNND